MVMAPNCRSSDSGGLDSSKGSHTLLFSEKFHTIMKVKIPYCFSDLYGSKIFFFKNHVFITYHSTLLVISMALIINLLVYLIRKSNFIKGPYVHKNCMYIYMGFGTACHFNHS